MLVATHRLHRLTVVVLSFVLLVGLPLATLAEGDTTPPSGTVTINSGATWSISPTVTLTFDVTDDIGPITTVEVRSLGLPWESYPYAPTLQWTIPDPYAHGDGGKSVDVRWTDAAGNVSAVATASIMLDTVPPIGKVEAYGEISDDTLPFRFNGSDQLSGLDAIWFSSDGGASWGMAVPIVLGVARWPFLDPAYGGGPVLGHRSIVAQASDVAGNWTAPRSLSVFIDVPKFRVDYSPDPRTGHPITLTPRFPDGSVLPSGTWCWWELRWGDIDSLIWAKKNETYGHVLITGSKSKGYCGPWTFTLPWTPVRQFQLTFMALTPDWGPIAEFTLGSDPHDHFIKPTVDSTDRRIRESNLPLVQVLPDRYELIVGQPVTYRAYSVAGATFRSDDEWFAMLGEHYFRKKGGTSYTFTPDRPGYWEVCWSGAPTRTYQISACYDPPARYRDTSPPNTTAPVQKIVSGATLEATVPVRLTWSGTDRGWGIASYRLQQSINGGAWKTISLPKAKSTSITRQLAIGTSHRFRVRATDKAGNIGSWDYGPTFTPRTASESSAAVTYTKAWTVDPDPTARGGRLVESAATGASATYRFTGRDVAWLAERGPGRGTAKVYVNGVYVRTVDLEASVEEPRWIVFTRHWSTVAARVLRIVVVGAVDRPIVSVDGFIRLR